MSLVTPTPIADPALPQPDASDLGSWPARMQETLRWLREDAVPGVSTQSGVAYENALEAANMAAAAQAAANYAGVWSSLTGALPAGKSVYHASKFWLSLVALANVTTVTPGTNGAIWAPLTTDAGGVSYGAITVSAMLDRLAAGMARMSALRNKVINCNFACNSRRVSGTIVLAANAFGHDMWFGGASGGTYIVTGIIATITAGALRTVVEGSRIHTTGNHVLSWAGTAQARINGGSLVSSPAVGSLTAGSNVTLEWATGTVSQVQLEEGDLASAWQPPDPALQRVQADFYCQSCIAVVGSAASNYFGSSFGASSAYLIRDFNAMRASPNLSAINGNGIEYFSFGSAWVASTMTYSIVGYSPGGFRLFVTLSSDGDGRAKLIRRTAAGDAVVIMSAELTA